MFYYYYTHIDKPERIISPLLFEARFIKKKMKRVFKKDTEFSKRIRKRHATYWKSGKKIPLFSAEDSLEKWKNPENWQRLLTNKHNSREFALKLGIKVPQLYWKGRTLDQLNLNDLPSNFVIRPTMGFCSKNVYLMKDGYNLFNGRCYTKENLIFTLQKVLNRNPEIEFLFEEFLTNERGEFKIPDDYKFYTFNGEIACVRVINRLSPTKGANQYYDKDWNLIKNLKKTKYSQGAYQPPPACFMEMKNQVKELSKAFRNFVRIDFYATKDGPVFGEFASTPSRGYGYSTYGSDFLIEKWDRYCEGMI